MKATTTANAAIAMAVLRANSLFIILYPRIIKGALTIIKRRGNEKEVTFAISNEMPTAPPSIKLFGSRKPLSPNPADKTPREIRKIAIENLFTEIFRLRISLAVLLLA